MWNVFEAVPKNFPKLAARVLSGSSQNAGPGSGSGSRCPFFPNFVSFFVVILVYCYIRITVIYGGNGRLYTRDA